MAEKAKAIGFVGYVLAILCTAAISPATLYAADYYVDKTHAQASDTNPGTAALPWKTIRRAADLARAGDKVYVKGNGVTYTEPDSTPAWTTPTLNPVNSGTASQPIIFSAYPGHTVTVTSGNWVPVIGAGNRNYIIWEGFRVLNGGGLLGGYATALSNGSNGSEIRYCEIIGTLNVNDPSAMYTGLLMHGAGATRFHHNIVHGFKGSSNNQAGIIAYESTGSIIEDNYIYDNWLGIFSKQMNNNVTWRRNWSTNNESRAMTLNAAGAISGRFQEYDTKIYDNVFDNLVDIYRNNFRTEVHNNLFRTGGNILAGWENTTFSVEDYRIWNNVVIGVTHAWWQEWARTGKEFDYFDYNFYTGTPSYRFPANEIWMMAQMRSLGYENNSQQNISQSNIYDAGWNLKAPYRTAGRHGDAVGPGNGSDGLIGQITNPNRYGPKALGGGGGSTAPSAPSNLRVVQ